MSPYSEICKLLVSGLLQNKLSVRHVSTMYDVEKYLSFERLLMHTNGTAFKAEELQISNGTNSAKNAFPLLFKAQFSTRFLSA